MSALSILWPQSSSDWAAWVQAIFTLLALAVAIGIGIHDRRFARKLEAERDLKKLEAVAAIAIQASVHIKDAIDALHNDATLLGYMDHGSALSQFPYIERGLTALPLHDLPEPGIIVHVWTLIDIASAVRRIVSRARDELEGEGVDYAEIHEHTSKLAWRAEQSVSRFEEAVREARGEYI